MNFLKSSRFFAFPFFFFRQIHLIEQMLKRTHLFLFLFLFLQHVIQAIRKSATVYFVVKKMNKIKSVKFTSYNSARGSPWPKIRLNCFSCCQ